MVLVVPKPVPFWDELKLVQKTIYRKSSTQNGPRSMIMVVALNGHGPDHARWVLYIVGQPFLAVMKGMQILVSIGFILMVLELPSLNINTK